ncbi:ABC transporter substrate-binding protein, LivK homolog [Candidatus Profftella armatura (Diaphorina cf. continua)]|uniref:ABC transporter substrate-binding protein, LivK homolog n=1 Tax=Candidatus Profftella armatura (Diaphorina cf. continua) TaxID=2661583 RepID=A0A7R7ABN6_9PROT|nr:amino acid ABC transporter substrate-binding protein [Candidatus Profftella armatura (Diaphorina cf. continua)]BCG49548.1 ABC transporter substrate-binding protein, LivK homolog [Candidatus Profftella armatura (Diaphorina cf. continua)]
MTLMRYHYIPKINIIFHILFFLFFFIIIFPGKITYSKEIKIGTSIPLTGQFSDIGKYYHDAYQLTVDKINANGGVKINNSFKKLSLKLYDNQSDIGINRNQYTKLITKDKVNFLLGPFLNNFILNNSLISEKYKTLMMQSCGVSDQILSKNFKYIFGLLIPAKNYFENTIKILKKMKIKNKNIVFLYANDAFNTAIANGASLILKKAHLNKIINKTYSLNTIDFTSLISQIKNINTKIILFAGYEENIINFIRQIKIFKIKSTFFSFTSDLLNKNIKNLLKNEDNYTYGITPWLPNFNLKDRWFNNAQNFSNEYKKKFGYYPDYHSVFAVIDIESLVYAIEKANDINQLKVKKQLKKINFNNVYGKITFNQNNKMIISQKVIKIQNNKLIPVHAKLN